MQLRRQAQDEETLRGAPLELRSAARLRTRAWHADALRPSRIAASWSRACTPNLEVGIGFGARAERGLSRATGAARAAVHISPHLQRASTVPAPGLGPRALFALARVRGVPPEPHTHATNHMQPPAPGARDRTDGVTMAYRVWVVSVCIDCEAESADCRAATCVSLCHCPCTLWVGTGTGFIHGGK